MNETGHERRWAERACKRHAFSVLVDEQRFPAELTDISATGFQARVDAVTFDEIRERINGVRFGDSPPLPIKLHWGFFDGTFGASFRDQPMAEQIVTGVMEAEGKAVDPAQA